MAGRNVPRWKRKSGGVKLSGRSARQIGRQVARSQQRQGGKAVNQALAESGLRRARIQLVPLAWLAALLGTGLLIHLTPYPAPIAFIFALISGFALWGFTNHLGVYIRNSASTAAILDLVFLVWLAVLGPQHTLLAILLITWAGCAGLWVRHHHWHLKPEDTGPKPSFDDYATWNKLAAKKRWEGSLGPCEQLPGGGRRYPIRLDGTETVISNILSEPERIAGSWDKPMTEAYAERASDGIVSHGYLTILGRDTLMTVRHWNGEGINPATGTAVIGRYADGTPAQLKFYAPRNGVRHALISGTTGSGKSGLLDQLIMIALASRNVIPVVLDPQEGQSLPFWRNRTHYASGPEECLAALRGLHAGMLARSRHLRSLKWDDDGIAMDGMPFFDLELTGLPIILAIFDEAHMLLSDPSKLGDEAIRLTADIGRMGRKTGLAMWLGTQVPSLDELGKQAVRDMLRSGNVVCFRTANSVSAGMLGLEKDPSVIPPYFTDGTETAGLGYVGLGPDNRPDAPMRSDLVPKSARRKQFRIPEMDDMFAEPLARAMSGSQMEIPAPKQDEPEPEGRTAVDAVWKVLDDDGGELANGEVSKRAAALVTGEWGRGKAYSLTSIGNALAALTQGLPDGRRITRDGRMYRTVKEG